jgi:hypothetical protein
VLPPEIVAEISKAAKLGLAEFLRLFIDYTEGVSAPDRLDPSAVVTVPKTDS